MPVGLFVCVCACSLSTFSRLLKPHHKKYYIFKPSSLLSEAIRTYIHTCVWRSLKDGRPLNSRQTSATLTSTPKCTTPSATACCSVLQRSSFIDICIYAYIHTYIRTCIPHSRCPCTSHSFPGLFLSGASRISRENAPAPDATVVWYVSYLAGKVRCKFLQVWLNVCYESGGK